MLKSGWEPLLECVSPSAAEAPPPPATSNAAHKLAKDDIKGTAEEDVLNQQDQKRKVGTSSVNWKIRTPQRRYTTHGVCRFTV